MEFALTCEKTSSIWIYVMDSILSLTKISPGAISIANEPADRNAIDSQKEQASHVPANPTSRGTSFIQEDETSQMSAVSSVLYATKVFLRAHGIIMAPSHGTTKWYGSYVCNWSVYCDQNYFDPLILSLESAIAAAPLGLALSEGTFTI